jgi:4a-hydroxytetrahydrobiopterin dehydratase
MCNPHTKKCCSCSEPLTSAAVKTCMKQLKKGWKVVRGHHIEKDYAFDDFAQALAFVNKVGVLAEHENHHPDIALSWGKVKVILWTHSAGGLTEKDFMLASKCDFLI